MLWALCEGLTTLWCCLLHVRSFAPAEWLTNSITLSSTSVVPSSRCLLSHIPLWVRNPVHRVAPGAVRRPSAGQHFYSEQREKKASWTEPIVSTSSPGGDGPCHAVNLRSHPYLCACWGTIGYMPETLETIIPGPCTPPFLVSGCWLSETSS